MRPHIPAGFLPRALCALCVCAGLGGGPVFAQERLTLLFAGDLMQHQAQLDAARTPEGYDYAECFRHVQAEIERADVAIGNLEVTLGGPPYAGYPAFSAPDAYAEAIREAGFDVLLTANNHCLDRGRHGLERTIRVLDSMRVAHVGTYRTPDERASRYPLRIEKNGFVIALLCYTYGTNGIAVQAPNVVNYIDREQMAKDILEARRMKPDAIIACVHWGTEYRSMPDASQRELADWMLAQGVTHVIGGHPHVVQPMEARPDSRVPDRHVVVYSLGNCLSNMSAPQTDGGAWVKLELKRYGRIVRLAECRYCLVWTSRPALSGRRSHVLYPVNVDHSLLNPTERARMHRFVDGARALLDRHNVWIEEYEMAK